MAYGSKPGDDAADELREYQRAIESHQDHPVVKQWFHQITPCRLVVPGGGAASFLMIEFRDGRLGAMVWADGTGNWGTGGWRPLSRGVPAIDIGYMQGAPAARTFAEVLEMVAARRAEAPPPRPWWRFWG
jgi:hypothetical protein